MKHCVERNPSCVTNSIPDVQPYISALIQHPDPYKPLLPLLKHSSNPEDPIPLLASAAISKIISYSLGAVSKTSSQIQEAIPKLNSYLSTLANSTDSGLQDIAVQQYSAILRNRKSRELFWNQRSETLNPLIDILRAAAGPPSTPTNGDTSSALASGRSSIRSAHTDGGLAGGVNIQLLYHVLLVIWQISFEAALVGPGLDTEHDLVPLYATLIRISPKEKLTRLLLSTLSNLFAAPENSTFLLPAATTSKLPALLANLKTRHLTDNDLVEDLDTLKKHLDDYATTQTTFQIYADELRGGHLRWSPPHKNASFWAENARTIIETDKGELLTQLAGVLSKPWDGERQVLAIACNDVGWLVKECPEKKAALEKAGLKVRVMELMQNDDETVRWEALRAVGEWLRYSFDN